MPLVEITVFKGALSEEKKTEMITRVSEVVAEVEAQPHPKEKLLPHTICMINEIEPSHYAIGGQRMSLEALKDVLEG